MESNQIINDLLDKNLVKLLEFMYLHDPEMVKEQLQTRNAKGESLLMQFLHKNRYDAFSSNDLYDFFIKIGYDIKSSIINTEKKSMPEYIAIAHSGLTTDNLLAHITRQIGAEYMNEYHNNHQEMNKENIIYFCFQNNYVETLKVLNEMNLKMDLVESDNRESYFGRASLNPQSLALYWELKKQKNPQQLNDFPTDFDWLKNKLDYSSKMEEYRYGPILNYIESKFSNYTQDQKEKILLLSFKSNTPPIYNKLFKLMGTTIDKYKSNDNPLWKMLPTLTDQSVLYRFIKNGLNFKENVGNEYSVVNFMHFLKRNNVKLEAYRMSSRDSKMKSIITQYITKDFLTSKVPNKNINYFTAIINSNAPKDFMSILNIDLGNLSMNGGLNTTIDYLQKTWFLKNEQGLFNIEYSILNKGNYPELLFNKAVLESNIYNNEQLEKMLSAFFNSSHEDINNNFLFKFYSLPKSFKNIYEHMKTLDTINWSNVEIPLKIQKTESKELLEVINEIRVFKTYNELQKKIPTKDETLVKKNKI